MTIIDTSCSRVDGAALGGRQDSANHGHVRPDEVTLGGDNPEDHELQISGVGRYKVKNACTS